MRIDVDPAGTVAAGIVAGRLGRTLRQATGRLEQVCPTPSGAAALAAWASTWETLRSALLGLATAGEVFETNSHAAEARFRDTESGSMVADGD